MNYFDTLEKKRKHIAKYSDKIPPKESVERALWKAWKTTPGTNNAMAYQALVWGPDNELEKEAENLLKLIIQMPHHLVAAALLFQSNEGCFMECKFG